MARDAELAERLAAVRQRIAAALQACGRPDGGCRLLAVSKKKPQADILAAIAAGQLEFGENRVQELQEKGDALQDALADAGATWHFIGSLQTNKVKHLLRVPCLGLLHSLDRVDLADALQKRLEFLDGTLKVLLQVDATGDDSKHGVLPTGAASLLGHVQAHCPRVRVQGLMAMGPLEGDPAPVFQRVAELRESLRAASGLELPELSLGMSGDLEAGIAAGSTLVRVGSDVFGARA